MTHVSLYSYYMQDHFDLFHSFEAKDFFSPDKNEEYFLPGQVPNDSCRGLLFEEAWRCYHDRVFCLPPEFFDIDQPVREGDAVLVIIHPTPLFVKAKAALHDGLAWDAEKQDIDLESSIALMRYALTCKTIAKAQMSKWMNNIEKWVERYPGNTEVFDLKTEIMVQKLSRTLTHNGYFTELATEEF